MPPGLRRSPTGVHHTSTGARRAPTGVPHAPTGVPGPPTGARRAPCELIVRGLEPQVLPGDPIELAAEPVELLAVGFAAVVGRGVCRQRAGERGGGRVRDEEGLVALLAADLPGRYTPAGRSASDRQIGQATMIRSAGGGAGAGAGAAGHARCSAGTLPPPAWPLLGHEDLVAMLAADLLAEISPPDPQPGRTMRAMGDEMGLGVDHGITLACRQRAKPTHAGVVAFLCREDLRFPLILAGASGGIQARLSREGRRRRRSAWRRG